MSAAPQPIAVEEPPYVIAILKDGYWVEQCFHTSELARAAWKQIPNGVYARYFVEGALVAEAGRLR